MVQEPTVLLVVTGVLINFVWQIFNVYGHFKFLKNENPGLELTSLLSTEGKDKNFSSIAVDDDLLDSRNAFHYSKDMVNGVLTNEAIDQLLLDPNASIELVFGNNKKEKTDTYISQFRETLLKFLNHKWHDVNCKGGTFTNDKKVCFASELFLDEGKLKWRITKGCYYHGYLTNFIFSKYISGSHYMLYPPMNMGGKMEIKSLSDSDLSDHIGVSTLLCTEDDWALVFYQSGNASYNAHNCMPSGSGSLDFADYKKGDTLSEMVVKGAERELMEETTMNRFKKRMKIEGVTISTRVLSYYRDMERGGKPEFCCISRVNKDCEQMKNFILPDEHELEKGRSRWMKLDNDKGWEDLLQDASLALKMNYVAVVNAPPNVKTTTK